MEVHDLEAFAAVEEKGNLVLRSVTQCYVVLPARGTSEVGKLQVAG